MLEFGDGIPQTPLIWMHTLICLVPWTLTGTEFFTVDFDFMSFRAGYQPHARCCMLAAQLSVQATQLSVRMSVFGRLEKTEFVDAELSLRYWASHDNLFQFVLVPLQSYEDYRSTQFTHGLFEEERDIRYPQSVRPRLWHLRPGVVAKDSETNAPS